MLSGPVTTRTGKRALQATPLQDGRPLVIAPPCRTIQRTRHRLNGEIFPALVFEIADDIRIQHVIQFEQRQRPAPFFSDGR